MKLVDEPYPKELFQKDNEYDRIINEFLASGKESMRVCFEPEELVENERIEKEKDSQRAIHPLYERAINKKAGYLRKAAQDKLVIVKTMQNSYWLNPYDSAEERKQNPEWETNPRLIYLIRVTQKEKEELTKKKKN